MFTHPDATDDLYLFIKDVGAVHTFVPSAPSFRLGDVERAIIVKGTAHRHSVYVGFLWSILCYQLQYMALWLSPTQVWLRSIVFWNNLSFMIGDSDLQLCRWVSNVFLPLILQSDLINTITVILHSQWILDFCMLMLYCFQITILCWNHKRHGF